MIVVLLQPPHVGHGEGGLRHVPNPPLTTEQNKMSYEYHLRWCGGSLGIFSFNPRFSGYALTTLPRQTQDRFERACRQDRNMGTAGTTLYPPSSTVSQPPLARTTLKHMRACLMFGGVSYACRNTFGTRYWYDRYVLIWMHARPNYSYRKLPQLYHTDCLRYKLILSCGTCIMSFWWKVLADVIYGYIVLVIKKKWYHAIQPGSMLSNSKPGRL